MPDEPYAWRSARSRNGSNSSVEEMEDVGRAPSRNIRGQIRGFRSRPGAPLSDRDSMHGLGIAGTAYSPDRKGAWESFFKRPTPAAPAAIPPTGLDELAPVSSGDYMGADLSAVPSLPSTPAENINATIAETTSWMKQQGLPVPPPPNPATGAIAPVVPPVSPGWNITTPQQVNRIATQYDPKRPVAKNPWGKPLPRI